MSNQHAELVPVSSPERNRCHVATEGAVQGTLEDSGDELVRPNGRAVDDEHEGSTPAFGAEIPEAHQGKLPAQVVEPRFDTRRFRLITEATAGPAPHLAPKTPTEVPNRLLARALTQAKQESDGNVESGAAFVVEKLSARQVEDDGTGRVEAGYHRVSSGAAGEIAVGPRCACKYRVVSRRSVKSPGVRSSWARRVILGLVTTCAALSAPAGAQSDPQGPSSTPRERPFLLGGPVTKSESEVPVDPALPRGALRWMIPRPEGRSRRCDLWRPVCVHAPPSTDRELVARALADLTAAYERHQFGLALPAPLSDGGLGGGDELDWYLEPGTDFEVHQEPIPSRGFDRAAGYCVADPTLTDRRRLADLCVAEVSALRLAPSQTPHGRRGYANHIRWTGTERSEGDYEVVRLAQRRPSRALLQRPLGPEPGSAGLLFEYLDRVAGSRAPGTAATAAVALLATTTRAGALRWYAEPDLADVLRSSLENRRPRIARFWDDFARSRLSIGEPDGWLPWPGEAAPLTIAWTLKASSLPRNWSLPRPLDPSGSAYLVVEMDQRPAGIAIRATCEAPVSYVWSVIRLADDGTTRSVVRAPFLERNPISEQRISDLDGIAKLVLVGTNLGGVDLAHPFDPDHSPFEPHGCTIYLAPL